MGVQITLKKAATGETDQERCVILGHYIVENNATVRAAAQKFGVSKSTVHQDITVKLAQVNKQLHDEVKAVLEKNKQERHLRGGQATRRKYEELSKRRLKQKA
ncbi:MAG: sporulation transcriptional regulator SpoIIID [Oscillospiraceae bacterium]|nr:sporulation transcriptional regulator SpoIIID [Oscillospiraceae bacterium]